MHNSHNGFYWRWGSRGQAPSRWNLQYFKITTIISMLLFERFLRPYLSTAVAKLLAGPWQGTDWSPLIGPWLNSLHPKPILLQVCPLPLDIFIYPEHLKSAIIIFNVYEGVCFPRRAYFNEAFVIIISLCHENIMLQLFIKHWYRLFLCISKVHNNAL